MPYLEFKNLSVIAAPVNDFAAPEPLDLVWISLNYHDLHDPFFAPADVAKINKAVFAALKPGGRYVVIDHAAAAGVDIILSACSSLGPGVDEPFCTCCGVIARWL